MKFKYPFPMSTLAFAALLLSPTGGHAQSILGSAENFVLLAGTAITVASPGPNTFANGDVGAISGIAGLTDGTNSYPPVYGTVTDGTIYLNQPVVTNAVTDLGLAQDKLRSLAVTTDFTATPTLGGRTLDPGVYNFGVAADLTGILTLDAGGKNNVTWVINIGTSLTTAANAQVVFINLGSNGGVDNGLFWNADAAITFGAENIIAGNYLAGTGISFGTTAGAEGSGSGRALAGAEVTFDGQGNMDLLGTGGDLTGGLDINGDTSGYVLLSGNGTYTAGLSDVILRPGVLYNTANVTIDGNSANTLVDDAATLTVFNTLTTLTGINTYTGGTIVDGGVLTAATGNLPTNGNISLIDSNLTGTSGEMIFDQPTDGTFGGIISGTGSVTKEDVGALTLTGENTYTGGTTVNGGSLIVSSASLPGDVALANSSGLVFDQATDGSFDGVISGDGTVTKENAGILTVTGVNTYTGGTTVNEGTLALSGLGTLGDTTGALAIDVGTLDLGETSQTVGAVTLGGDGVITNGTLTGTSYTSTGGTVDAVLAGDGIVLTNTSGTTILTGANTYSGGTTVNGGTLVASTSILPADQNVVLVDNTRLVLNELVDGTFGGEISGAGTIEKQGAGTLRLANATTAELDLQAGAFMLGGDGEAVLPAGDIGATNVALGSFFGGVGTILGNLINGGTVSPGNSPGTMFVVGNYTQLPGGTLIMEIASAVSFDQLIISGTADLDGTLQLDLLNGYEPVGEDFTIITAAGGLNGTEFDVVTGSAALTALVNYNANDVVVSFAQTDFETFAGTPNQIAVANAAQQSPALTTALNGVPLASQMPAALNALSPQGYQVWSDIAFAHTASLADRLGQQSFTTPGDDDLYFEVAQSRGYLHGDRDVDSARYTSESGLVGINHGVNENLTVGAFFEYTESRSGLGSSGSDTEVKDKMPGVRAAWKRDGWFGTATAAYGFDDYESTRAINFAGTSEKAKSKTKGSQWLLDVTAGHRFQAGLVSLSPFAGLQASGWKADGFTETGAGAFNATVADQSARSLRTQLGLEAAVNFAVGSAVVSPHVRAAWVHELSNDARSMDASFGAVDYAVETRDPQRDSARLSAGLDVAFSPAVGLYADYTIQTGDRSRVIGEWSAGVSVRF